ncbi:MAG: putative restriction endonuclease [Sphingomonadales bacterium]|nr:putative restriction endonuclease [Sphingomonadales bacterium]
MAIAEVGWDVEILSQPNVHPLELRMSRGRVHFNIRAYIWNLSHGGRTRSAEEYRIQVTSGVGRFQRMTGEQTLILGWSNDLAVFAAFDFDRHSGALGSSPSLQVSKGTLEAARDHGIAARSKGNNEIVVALRPMFLPAYVEQRAKLHNPAETQAAIEALRQDPLPELDEVSDELEAVQTRIRSGTPLHFGTAVERRQRRLVLDRLAALEEEIQRLRAQPGMIGHNLPPPDDDELSPSVREVGSAIETIRGELGKPAPDAATVAERGGLIERAARVWRALIGEVRKMGGALKERARERLAETLLVAAYPLAVLMHKVASGVLTWLQLILS